jgi:nucleoside-diphosphate-sugar epimerase
MNVPEEVFLVTGAAGCVGAWAIRALHQQGVPFVAVDLTDDKRRLRMILDEEDPRGVFVQADISAPAALDQIVSDHQVTHIVHLAALQIPACAANPSLGAEVNVVGTVNILESIRRTQGRVQGFCYASSVAVFNAGTDRRVGTDEPSTSIPTTLYGAYKRTVETVASIYLSDFGIGSIGLRPCVIYGPGRDQGLTSDVSNAMWAAATGVPSTIRFSGPTTFQYAADVASIALAAARASGNQAACCDLGGSSNTVQEVVELIERSVPEAAGSITVTGSKLPFPPIYDPAPLQAQIGPFSYEPLSSGVSKSIERFRALYERGTLGPPPH